MEVDMDLVRAAVAATQFIGAKASDPLSTSVSIERNGIYKYHLLLGYDSI